ncbi:MAG: DUF992 domain-containing protein [Rhodospirillaceae bacterium]|nr:DUF992 domain-containing protein [Rhodospirillaceae bacterium]
MTNCRNLATLAMAAFLMVPVMPAAQAEGGVNVGVLDCHVSGSVGYLIGSDKTMTCVFKRPDGSQENYRGEITRYGLDIGFTRETRMFWGVVAPGNVARGALAGTYAGAGADVAAGLGVGANALFGGGNSQIALQPVSVNGNVGVNVAAGVSKLTLAPGM